MARTIMCRVVSWKPLSWEAEDDGLPVLDGDEFVYVDEESGELQLLGRAVGGPFGFVSDDEGGWREWSVESDTDERAPAWAEDLKAGLARLARQRRPSGPPQSDDPIEDVLAGLPAMLTIDDAAEALGVSPDGEQGDQHERDPAGRRPGHARSGRTLQPADPAPRAQEAAGAAAAVVVCTTRPAATGSADLRQGRPT